MSENDANANLGNGGTGDQDGQVATRAAFESQLDKDLQGSERLTSYGEKTLSDFIRDSFTQGDELKTLREQSEGMTKIPGEDATPEERAEFNTKIGVPETADGYEFVKPEDWPDTVPYSEELANEFKAEAHKHGTPKGVAEALFKWNNDRTLKEFKKIQKWLEDGKAESEKKLRNVWPGDNYEKNGTEAKKFFNVLAEKSGIEKADLEEWVKVNDGVLSDPVVLRILHAGFQAIGDDSFIEGTTPKGESDEPRRTAGGIPVFSSYGKT